MPAPLGPLCVYLHGVHDPGNVGTVLRSARRSAPGAVAIGPGTCGSIQPQGGARFDGRCVRRAGGRVENVAALPGETVALVAAAGTEAWRLRPT